MSDRVSFQLRLCMFLNYCAYAIQLNSVGIAVLQCQRSFGVSVVEASTLAFYKGTGILGGALLAGAFLKRIGYKRAMLLALGASTLALVAVPAFVTFTTIKVVFLITGLSYGLMKVALYSTIGLVAPEKTAHASLLSFVESFYKIGSLLTFVVFSIFIDNANEHSTTWSHAYPLLAVLMAVAFGLLWRTPLDESRVRENPGLPWSAPMLDLIRLAIAPVAVALGILVFACIVAEHGFINFLPTFNHRVMGLVPSLGIQLAGLYAICAIIGRVCVGFLLRRISWFPILMSCVVGAALVLALGLSVARPVEAATIADWRVVPVAVWLLPLTGLFIGPIWPVMHSAALTTLPVQRQNTLASLSVVFSSTAGAVGTPLLGLVFQQYGGMAALAVLFVPLVLLVGGTQALRKIKRANPVAGGAAA